MIDFMLFYVAEKLSIHFISSVKLCKTVEIINPYDAHA